MNTDVLATIEVYYDAVPRSAARVEELSPFVLFAQEGAGWMFYARPQLGAQDFTAADVDRVRARQRVLGIRESFEWVAETTPGLHATATEAGLSVANCPLMVQSDKTATNPASSPGVSIRLVTPEDDLVHLNAIAGVAFGFPGTARSDAGLAEVARAVAESQPEQTEILRNRIATGATVMAVALVEGLPVASGSHHPVDTLTEVTGVATLPTYRRRGIGATLTAFLVRDAWERGVRTVFLSAGDGEIARLYEQVGFRRIGTACIAAPAEG